VPQQQGILFIIFVIVSHKIRYIIIGHVLSRLLNIYIYQDTGIMEVDSTTGSMDLEDPGVQRHHHMVPNTHSMFPSS